MKLIRFFSNPRRAAPVVIPLTPPAIVDPPPTNPPASPAPAIPSLARSFMARKMPGWLDRMLQARGAAHRPPLSPPHSCEANETRVPDTAMERARIANQAACEKAGLPIEHAQCFQTVASETDCVIAVRAIGPCVTGLVRAGHASKGFHIKAKSCDWGPMAGFVLSDPRLTKHSIASGASERQRRDIHTAIHQFGAQETQVHLSGQRLAELITMGCMAEVSRAPDAMVVSAISPAKKRMTFVLKRQTNIAGADGADMWTVFYHPGQSGLAGQLQGRSRENGKLLVPVLALVDPACVPAIKGTYRAAITADYDLFGVFPNTKDFDRRGRDQRPVPGSDRFVVPMQEYARYEDQDKGNITPRIADINAMLNVAIRAAGYAGGAMVHHSDEVGRPKVNGVEYPFIAFIPNQKTARFVENNFQFGKLMRETMAYQYTMNSGWQRTLGFSVTPKGNWET